MDNNNFLENEHNILLDWVQEPFYMVIYALVMSGLYAVCEIIKKALFPGLNGWVSVGVSILLVMLLGIFFVCRCQCLLHAQLIDVDGAQEKMENALKAKQDLEFILQQSPVVAYLRSTGGDMPIEYLSHNFGIFGYSTQDLLSGRVKYAELIHRDDVDRVIANTEKIVQEGKLRFQQEYRIVTGTGDIRWLDDIIWIRRDPEGAINQLQGILVDITGRKSAEQALRQSKEYAENVIETANILVVGFDSEGKVRFLNESAERISGYSRDELKGKDWFQIVSPAEIHAKVRDKFIRFKDDQKMTRVTIEEFIVTKGGNKHFISWQISKEQLNRNSTGFIAFGMDLTERKLIEEQIRYMSIHDALTGLYNRQHFEETIKKLDSGNCENVGLVVCDIDELKMVNDFYGHKAGDTILIEAAGTIKSVFRTQDVVCRIGGDEFAVFLPMGTEDTVAQAADRLKKAIAEYNAAGPSLNLGISIGYAAREDTTTSMEDLFIEADNKMYEAKNIAKSAIRQHNIHSFPGYI
jgi:diguanylate cyclase (GGDEF)-like protein/PAS domain S-box-containing protein